jgi:hypothetical protein
MHTLNRYPRCQAYLKAMGVRLDEPAMTDFWAAVTLADQMPEEDLRAVGFDPGTGPIANRDAAGMLESIETALDRKRSVSVKLDDMESLKAFLGSRGVKVSNLPDEAAYWYVASILWPATVRKGRTGNLTALVSLIRAMPKKQRQSARRNIMRVPQEWRALVSRQRH